ncbi:MAG TPA: hypothetical protein VFY81_06995 [Gammaproteobacteria bacterium]|jgi:hypothetical protein|nr:hypothetical protein [Gammaproteobacteria bacterium]
MDAEWILLTLRDAATSLDELIEDIDDEPDAAHELLEERMATIYAKLNYAWNTRDSGPAALDTVDHDELVGWPKDLSI